MVARSSAARSPRAVTVRDSASGSSPLWCENSPLAPYPRASVPSTNTRKVFENTPLKAGSSCRSTGAMASADILVDAADLDRLGLSLMSLTKRKHPHFDDRGTLDWH